MLVRALLFTTLLGCAANELDAEQCDRAEEEAELLDVQLLQTSFQITPKAKAERAVKAVAQEQHWTGGAAMPEEQSLLQTSFEVSLSSTVFTGGIVGNEGWRLQPNASCFVDGLWPVSGTAPLLVQLGTVHELGNLGRSEPARTSTAFYFMDMLSSRSSLVLTVYFCIYLFSIVSIHYNMTTRVKDKAAPGKVPQESCLEDEIYKRNPLSWLCVSWLNPMVAKLGASWSSAMSKCNADELPAVNPPSFQAQRQGERFEKLWREELEQYGDQASFVRAMMKLWTYPRLLLFQLLLFLHVVVGNLYQVFLIQYSLNYFFWLQEYVRQNGQHPDMTKPILWSIVAFSFQPLLFAVLCSYEANLSMKFDQATAGVGVVMFRKTQRLPAASLGPDGKSTEEPKPGEPITRRPNAMMVVNNDVIANFHGLAFSTALTFNATFTVAILLILMAVKLRLATLFCLGVAVPALTVSVVLSGAMGINMMQLQDVMDKRIYMIREVMKGIRIVKCYAWEQAMEDQITKLRTRELGILQTYFKLCTNFVALFNVFPRLLTCAGLWGFIRLYGRHDLASIFACLQILASLRQESSVLSGGLQRLVTVRISAARIETYLRLEEAPVLPGVSVPKWVDIWAEDSSQRKEAPVFKLSGSFRWSQDPNAVTVLHEISMEVKPKEMVAIVGGVGCGKSTLLEAALGELYPAKDSKAHLSRPHVCGYCAQVPHIAEGTLRENVIFGCAFDEARYQKAIAASGLQADLKLLPGGDEAFIGARGISLSGGQRARVALARAAYNSQAELVLLDDPFGSVDAPTAAWILEELLCGPLLADRAKLVVLQPEVERLRKFDRVYVLSEGRVVASGTPSEVAECEDFKQLQRSCSSEEEKENTPIGSKTSKEQRPMGIGVTSSVPAMALRESEHEGRPTLEMTLRYISIGKWRNLLNALVCFSLTLFLYLLCDISLANCTNALAIDASVETGRYFGGYLFWLFAGTSMVYIGWYFGGGFTLRISSHIHALVVRRLLHAPIDRFFDKHPVGRIMNRITMDMTTIDLHLFLKISGSIMIAFQTMVPLAYIHAIMPLSMTALSLPFYYVVASLYGRYQNTTVPLRYCFKTSSSRTQSYLSDVMTSTVVVRGFGEQQRLSAEYAAAVDDSLKADLTDDRLMKRWLCNRVNYLWTFYNSVTYIIGLYNCSRLGPGTLGIALTNLLLLEGMIEPSLDMMAGALFELIALARVHEYTEVPQERAMRTLEDTALRSYSVRFMRKAATPLTKREKGDEVEVLANGRVVLRSTKDLRGLMLAETGVEGFQELCPSCAELHAVPTLHHIVAANDATGCAKLIADEICKSAKSFMTAAAFASPPMVNLEFQSDWLSSGARLDVQELRAGYAEVPQDVLKGVTFSVEPRMKVAVVGTTGCGKSSMLLALLRIIEPRGGRIVINGIDTRDIGLATLRTALGLVPQDPMLFTGSLRHNLDPFRLYTDGRIKKAVEYAHLAPFVSSLPLGLDHQVTDEGGNLSFGQRQLLCLARMVLRQPALLLLDEATSAIDPATQESVQDTINHAFPTSTMLAVAHRLETIMEFDQVVVLDAGKVAEEGSVKEVAAKPGGIFRRMLDAKEKW